MQDYRSQHAVSQLLKQRISQRYRIRMLLDGLPLTTYDLAENPASIRPGFDVGFEVDGTHYINNHLMFTVLLHKQHPRSDSSQHAPMAAVRVSLHASGCLTKQRIPVVWSDHMHRQESKTR